MEAPDEKSTDLAEKTTHLPIVTAQDEANARMRQPIAARFEEEYLQCLAWAEEAFGEGFLPSHRHFLVDKADEDRCRKTGERLTAAKTVYTVKNDKGERRHFTVEDGQVVAHASHEAGFGDMLNEPHPTMTIEVKGEKVHPHRYSLCWASIELYHPKSAEQLAALRATRKANKKKRDDEKWAQDTPLLFYAGYTPEDFPPIRKKKR